ncbi:chemotaxis protein CheC [Bacillus licheniformis]|nr:chemotaxis protein CheC [Bacillus licheniformis]
MEVPFVKLMSFDELVNLFGGADLPVASIFCAWKGISRFYVRDHAFSEAEQLIRELVGNPEFEIDSMTPNDIGASALHELGNIMAGSYLTALADLTNRQMYPSVPELTLDMFGAVISEGLIELSQVGDQVIVIDNSILTRSTTGKLKRICSFCRTMIL